MDSLLVSIVTVSVGSPACDTHGGGDVGVAAEKSAECAGLPRSNDDKRGAEVLTLRTG